MKLNFKIQIHPIEFWLGSLQHVFFERVRYIDPSQVESVYFLNQGGNGEDVWVLAMASGKSIGITVEEFEKYDHLFI